VKNAGEKGRRGEKSPLLPCIYLCRIASNTSSYSIPTTWNGGRSWEWWRPCNRFICKRIGQRPTGFGANGRGWYPQERISLEETIYAYTIGPAILAGKQHVQGSITPGKWADLIVLDQDLFTIDADRIGETQVNTTIFAGAVVYRR
jgi:hypothetical protein